MEMDTLVGPLTLISDGQHLVGVHFGKVQQYLKGSLQGGVVGSDLILKRTRVQLKEYFQGRRKEFDIPLRLNGSEFQVKAWKTLQTIPFGKVISYSEQARRMKKPLAVRAVGGANGRNPLAIVVPCHRVIGSNGRLTGFGGGMPAKQALLRLEGLEIQK